MRQAYTPHRILLTGARAPVTLALARAFAGAGHTVFVADSFGPHLCQHSSAVCGSFEVPSPRFEPRKFFARLEQIVLLHHIDLVIPTCEEVLYVAQGAEHSPLREHFFVDRLETLERLHHKGKFIELCRNIGLRVPVTEVLGNRAELDAFCTRSSGRWVFKPAYSRFAARTQFWDAADGRGVEVQRSSYPLVAQAFLEGQEFCTYSVARQGQLIAHVAYMPRVRAGQGAGVYLESVDSARALAFAQHLASSLNFTGQFALDFIETERGIYPLECNPRAVSGAALLDGGALTEAYFSHAPEAGERGKFMLEVPPGVRSMFALPTLMYGWDSTPLPLLLEDLLTARDLIWDPTDPAPFFHQFGCLRAMQRRAHELGVSPLEASTWDLEWNGPGEA